MSTIGALGFDLTLDAFGARRVISETVPVALALLPSLGIGLLVTAAASTVAAVRSWDRARAMDVVDELEFVESAWTAGIQEIMPINEIHQAILIEDKYHSWLGDDPKNRAPRLAAIFLIHGYVRGRLMIHRGEHVKPLIAERDQDDT